MTSGQTKSEAYHAPQVIWLIPQGGKNPDTPWPCSGPELCRGSCTARSERSDNRNTEYSLSGTSSTSTVSPPRTIYDINFTLSVTEIFVRRCPQAPPSPPPLRLFSQGPRWVLPQKSALPPLATTPSLPPHTKILCWRTVPDNSRPRISLMCSFLPPRDGCNFHRRRCRYGVRQRCHRCCVGDGGASWWTVFTLPPTKWQKYKSLGLNF